MNTQELINKIGRLYTYGSKNFIERKEVIDLVKQLDEPQKVTVPQFVAGWIEKADKKISLRDLMSNSYMSFEVNGWLGELDEDGAFKNQETLVRAWLDGYEVEEEKRYLVKIKGVTCPYLNYDTINELWFYNQKIEGAYTKTQHTRKELEEAGFGDVFNSPLFEVEEVTE